MEQDWRLNGQKEYLQNAILHKIVFPEFWERAYMEKNKFFQNVLGCAKKHVKKFPNTREYLNGEKVQLFWHEHCDFCWEKAMTNMECEFYCTKDMQHWICKACFGDFKEKFAWTEKSADEFLND